MHVSDQLFLKSRSATEFVQPLIAELQGRYRRQLATSEALRTLDFTMEQPLAGEGWHNRESNGIIYWRFTGPASKATLLFPRVLAKLEKLRISIFHAVTKEHLEGLKVSYNGVVLTLIRRENGVLEYAISKDAIHALPYTHLEFSTLPSYRPDGDSRLLGVAIQRVEIC